MAADTVVRYGLSFLDSEGIKDTSVAHAYIDGAQTVTQVKTAVAALATAVNAVSGAQITSTRAEIILPGVTDGDKPVSGSEVQETGQLSFQVGASPYHWSLKIPAILETLTTGGEAIAPTGDVATLIALMLAGVNGGHYTGLNTDTLSAFFRSFQADRKHRRALFARSVNYTQPS